MNNKMTHTGFIVGFDSRTPIGHKKAISLRETKLYWISNYGSRYKKTNGMPPGENWPLYELDLESIQPAKPAQD